MKYKWTRWPTKKRDMGDSAKLAVPSKALLAEMRVRVPAAKCEACNDTGYYGDNGPGIRGNREYQPCDQCTPFERGTRKANSVLGATCALAEEGAAAWRKGAV